MANAAAQIANWFQNPGGYSPPTSNDTISNDDMEAFYRALMTPDPQAGSTVEQALPGMVPHSAAQPASLLQALSPKNAPAPDFNAILSAYQGMGQSPQATAPQSQQSGYPSDMVDQFVNDMLTNDGSPNSTNSMIRPSDSINAGDSTQSNLANDFQLAQQQADARQSSLPQSLGGTGGRRNSNFSGGGGYGGNGGGGGNGYGGGALHASDGEILMGLAASLLGGGGFQGYAGRASAVLGAQQASVEHNAELMQAMHRASPAGGMQKQQRDIYESRMNGDVNRFIKAKSQDVNGSIPQEEWEQGWQQLRSQYSPLGLDPGPSPFEIQWQASREASPEFRNAAITKQIKDEYGDSAAELAGAMLSGDPKAKEVAQLKLQLDRNRIEMEKHSAMLAKTTSDASIKQIETNRKRDLELYKQTGIVGQQLKKNSAFMVEPSSDYLQGESAINGFYDTQSQIATNGGRPNLNRMLGAGTSNVTSKNFPDFVKAMRGQMSPADHGDVAIFPPTISNSDPAVLSAVQAGKALDIADPRVAQAISQGRAVLVKQNGQINVARPKSGI